MTHRAIHFIGHSERTGYGPIAATAKQITEHKFYEPTNNQSGHRIQHRTGPSLGRAIRSPGTYQRHHEHSRPHGRYSRKWEFGTQQWIAIGSKELTTTKNTE